ncbi:MAG: sulfatase [Spirochaetes bacterium]|nr:sulfatase [Spirochaetota bacterium]
MQGRHPMKEKMTRRSLLRMGAGAAIGAGLSAAGLTACGGKIGDAAHGVLFSRDEFTGGGRTDAASVIGRAAGHRGTPPNIVVILCDDLGYGDLGCYGNRVIRTPSIDRLSAGGVRFTDFYASCSVCTPSRFGLLTGRYAVRGGLIFVMPASGESLGRFLIRRLGRWVGRLGATDVQDDCWVDGITDDEITLASALKVAGYRTGMVGKWHLGDFSTDPRYNPRRHGFDEFFGVPHSNDMWPCALYRDERQLEADIGLNQERLTGLYTREAVDFIERSKNGPFFLYLAHTFPHQPLYASERFKDKSRVGIFGDTVEEIDWSVGEIMTCLQRNGIGDNTIVVFTSDNGPWYNGSAGGFRGRKGQSYEGGYRVPFIVRWPGQVPAGSLCTAPAMNIDIFPTMLSAAGLAGPSDRIIDGRDIGGLMRGRAGTSPHDMLCFYHYEELDGIRVGNWKYFRNTNHYVWPQPVDKPTTFFGRIGKGNFGDWPNLYNFEVDREECYNLASRYPGVCRDMDARMARWEQELARNPRGWIRT